MRRIIKFINCVCVATSYVVVAYVASGAVSLDVGAVWAVSLVLVYAALNVRRRRAMTLYERCRMEARRHGK